MVTPAQPLEWLKRIKRTINRESYVARASSKIIINVAAGILWQAIADFGTAGQNLVGVVESTVVGEGVGAQRTLTSADGSKVVERLEAFDAASHQLSYSLLTDTPFRNCLTTIAVRNLGRNQAELSWSATFEADGLPSSEALELMEGALAANCFALKQFVEEE